MCKIQGTRTLKLVSSQTFLKSLLTPKCKLAPDKKQPSHKKPKVENGRDYVQSSSYLFSLISALEHQFASLWEGGNFSKDVTLALKRLR